MKRWKIVLVFVFLVSAAAIALDRYMYPYDVAREQEAARAAGLILDTADWPDQPLPAHRNALPDWTALAQSTRDTFWKDKQLDELGTAIINGSATPARRRAARQFLVSHGDLLVRVHKAAAKPSLYRRLTFNGFEDYPELTPMRGGAKLLRTEADLLALDGRYTEAIHTDRLVFSLAHHAAAEPTILGHLVSLSAENTALGGLREILLVAGPNASAGRLVRQTILTQAPERDLTRALKGEALSGVNTIRSVGSIEQLKAMASPKSTITAEPSRLSNWIGRYTTEQGEAVYLHWMTRWVEASRAPMLDLDRALEMVGRDYKVGARRPAYLMSNSLYPVFSKPGEREARLQSQRAVLAAAASVLAHKAQTGSWPARLDSSLAPLPDPYTDKPLGYRREGAGFVVYSVGSTGAYAALSGQPSKGEADFRYPGRPSPATRQ